MTNQDRLTDLVEFYNGKEGRDELDRVVLVAKLYEPDAPDICYEMATPVITNTTSRAFGAFDLVNRFPAYAERSKNIFFTGPLGTDPSIEISKQIRRPIDRSLFPKVGSTQCKNAVSHHEASNCGVHNK